MHKSRASNCSPEVINDFYDLLDEKLQQLGISNSPANIFNCDEVGFASSFGAKKIFCRRGEKNPHLMSDNKKNMYTVMVRKFFLKIDVVMI